MFNFSTMQPTQKHSRAHAHTSCLINAVLLNKQHSYGIICVLWVMSSVSTEMLPKRALIKKCPIRSKGKGQAYEYLILKLKTSKKRKYS